MCLGFEPTDRSIRGNKPLMSERSSWAALKDEVTDAFKTGAIGCLINLMLVKTLTKS